MQLLVHNQNRWHQKSRTLQKPYGVWRPYCEAIRHEKKDRLHNHQGYRSHLNESTMLRGFDCQDIRAIVKNTAEQPRNSVGRFDWRS